MGLDPAARVDERAEGVVVEAALRAPLRRHVDADGAAAAGVRHVLDVLGVDVLAHDLARHLADEVVVGRHLAADDREAEPPARVDRDHARVAAHRVAGEQHARDLGVDHQLDGDAHRRLVRAWPSRARYADRRERCRGSPSSRARRRRRGRRRAPRGTSPAGPRRSRPGCPRRARSSGPRPAARAELGVAPRDLVADRVRHRRGAHRLADRVRRGADGVDVVRRHPRHLGGDRAAEARLRRRTRGTRTSTRRSRAAPGSRRRSARRGSSSCRRTVAASARRSSASVRVWRRSLEDRHRARRAVDADALAGLDLRGRAAGADDGRAARTRGRRSRRGT